MINKYNIAMIAKDYDMDIYDVEQALVTSIFLGKDVYEILEEMVRDRSDVY